MKKRINNNQGGFIQIIFLIVVALLIMRYLGLTISGVLAYFNLSLNEIFYSLKVSLIWFRDLFNSVR